MTRFFLFTRIRLKSAFSLGGRGWDGGILTTKKSRLQFHEIFWQRQNSTFLRFFFKPRVVQAVVHLVFKAYLRNLTTNARKGQFCGLKSTLKITILLIFIWGTLFAKDLIFVQFYLFWITEAETTKLLTMFIVRIIGYNPVRNHL